MSFSRPATSSRSARVTGFALLGCLLPFVAAHAQKPVPVPVLNLNAITGPWFQIERLPDKAEKACTTDGMTLFALNDKKTTFQKGDFCRIKRGDLVSGNKSGKQNKRGNGDLRESRFVLLHTSVYVLALDPDGQWALVGTPNRKSLWLLSRTDGLLPAVKARMTAQAAAMGYTTAKLVDVPHTSETYRAVNGKPEGTSSAAKLPATPSPAQ